MERPPLGSKEWIEWAQKQPRSERKVYVEAVEDRFGEKTGISYFSICLEDSVKTNTDVDRIHWLIHDCFEDGSTVEEATDMIIELATSMGYLT